MRSPRLAIACLLAIATTATPALAQESLTVTFDTSATPNPQFGSENIVAVWVEDSLGAYVQTIGRWSDNINHRRYLYDWLAASGRTNDNPVLDGYLGGTFNDYQSQLMITWNLTNPAGALLPDGTYTIRMELADRNAGSSAENNEGTITFDKNGVSGQVTGASGGFNNVVIDYIAPDAANCGNGALDSGESCDDSGPDVCPTTCEETGDVCMVNTLNGDAAQCTARCEVLTVTQCVDDDGCCPANCDGMDNDCVGGGNASGACNATGAGGSSGLLLLFLGLLACRRRRCR